MQNAHMRVQRVQKVQRGRLTALRAEGCGGGFAASRKGRGFAAGCVEGLRKKVLRIDGPFRAQGFLSLTALRAEGCGGGFAASRKGRGFAAGCVEGLCLKGQGKGS